MTIDNFPYIYYTLPTLNDLCLSERFNRESGTKCVYTAFEPECVQKRGETS